MTNFDISSGIGRGAALVILALQLAACGGDTGDDGARPEAAPPVARDETSPMPPPEETSTAAERPDVAAEQAYMLTAADIDVYEQGLRREIEILRSDRERYQQAESDEERLEILAHIQPRELRREGAAAADVPEERYARILTAINDVLGKREMAAASESMAPSAADLANMPADVRARVEENLREAREAWGDPYAGLSAETTEALQRRAEDLARLRAEHIGLLTQPL